MTVIILPFKVQDIYVQFFRNSDKEFKWEKRGEILRNVSSTHEINRPNH